MNKPPPEITEEQKANYKELIRAAVTGRLGICATYETATGKPILVLVGKNPKPDGEVELVPFGTMFTEDPTGTIDTPPGFALKQLDNNSLTITE